MKPLQNGRFNFQVQHFKYSKSTSFGEILPNAFGFAETSFSWSVIKFILEEHYLFITDQIKVRPLVKTQFRRRQNTVLSIS